MSGALPTERAGGPADLSRDASQPKALIPSADSRLIHEALQFMFWAAGEGICPIDKGVPEPEEAFWQYCLRSGDEDWETIADRYAAAQGIEASGGDGTAPSRSDESPVAESDAP